MTLRCSAAVCMLHSSRDRPDGRNSWNHSTDSSAQRLTLDDAAHRTINTMAQTTTSSAAALAATVAPAPASASSSSAAAASSLAYDAWSKHVHTGQPMMIRELHEAALVGQQHLLPPAVRIRAQSVHTHTTQHRDEENDATTV